MYSFLLFFIQINVNGLQQSVLKDVACFVFCWCDVLEYVVVGGYVQVCEESTKFSHTF